MGRIVAYVAVMASSMALAACGGGADAAAEEEAKIREAVAFISQTEGSPGVFVKGRDIVVNYAVRPAAFASAAREAALAANKAVGGRQVKLYIVEGANPATELPGAGQFYCSITANDNRMAGNNC